MGFNLRNRSLLNVQDLRQREFRFLLDLAQDLKRAKYSRVEQKHLVGKTICLIFENRSTWWIRSRSEPSPVLELRSYNRE